MKTVTKCPVSGKRCLSKDEAKRQAGALRRRAFLPSERHTNAYRCPAWKTHADVGHYHVGRSVPRRYR